MKTVNILLFGITREIVGAHSLEIPIEKNIKTVADLKSLLAERYPKFRALRSLAIAIDKEYAYDEQLLEGSSEIALIPPVSGG